MQVLPSWLPAQPLEGEHAHSLHYVAQKQHFVMDPVVSPHQQQKPPNTAHPTFGINTSEQSPNPATDFNCFPNATSTPPISVHDVSQSGVGLHLEVTSNSGQNQHVPYAAPTTWGNPYMNNSVKPGSNDVRATVMAAAQRAWGTSATEKFEPIEQSHPLTSFHTHSARQIGSRFTESFEKTFKPVSPPSAEKEGGIESYFGKEDFLDPILQKIISPLNTPPNLIKKQLAKSPAFENSVPIEEAQTSGTYQESFIETRGDVITHMPNDSRKKKLIFPNKSIAVKGNTVVKVHKTKTASHNQVSSSKEGGARRTLSCNDVKLPGCKAICDITNSDVRDIPLVEDKTETGKQICRYLSRGHCPYGARCWFSHPQDSSPTSKVAPVTPVKLGNGNIANVGSPKTTTPPKKKSISRTKRLVVGRTT